MHTQITRLRTKTVPNNDQPGQVITLHEVTPEWVVSLNLSDRETGINRGNRKPDQATVERLASDILSGNWCETISPIHYIKEPSSTDNGKLCSGQHRLLAILKAQVPVYVEIRSVNLAEARYIDLVRKRTVSHAIAMLADGYGFEGDARALTKLDCFVRYLSGYRWATTGASVLTQRCSQQEIRSIWLANKAAFDSTRRVSTYMNENTIRGFVTLLIMSGADHNRITQFKSAIADPNSNVLGSDGLRGALQHREQKVGVNRDAHDHKLCLAVWRYLTIGDDSLTFEPSISDITGLAGVLVNYPRYSR